MKNITTWEEVVLTQRERFTARDPGVPRQVDIDRVLAHDRVVVISGVRRCGKSTLLRQLAERVDEWHFIDFDDERLLDFETSDFADLMVVFAKLSPARTILLDEIQNVAGWEHFVRRIHDEGYKVCLTGSNAKLLSGELATHLTGRYTKIELYPFSFAEIYYRGWFKRASKEDSKSRKASARARARARGIADLEFLENEP